MAELFGRKPLFAGNDYMHQLHLIIDILGTPSYEDTEYIASEKAKRYIRSLEVRPRVPFEKLFPHAPPVAIDFMDKLLQFAPEKRISVDEALQHPYLALLHDPNDEPVVEVPFDFAFESQELTKELLKDMLWDDIMSFRAPLFRKNTSAEMSSADDEAKTVSMDM